MDPPLIGIDLLEPERLAKSLRRRPKLAQRLFHPGELAYCEGQSAPERHLAARFSAKEAVTKALGINGFAPLDIEVVGGAANCDLRLHGHAAARAGELGVVVTVSLTHLAGVAGAVAMARPASEASAASGAALPDSGAKQGTP
jgi:holo-[acyl-carrier protein] synthase